MKTLLSRWTPLVVLLCPAHLNHNDRDISIKLRDGSGVGDDSLKESSIFSTKTNADGRKLCIVICASNKFITKISLHPRHLINGSRGSMENFRSIVAIYARDHT